MTYAFNGSRCARFFDVPNYMGKTEQNFLRMFLATTSTSQYFSSTGKCKMLGGISKSQKKLFIAHNSEYLKKDIIRANGDYIAAVTFLYGCDENANDKVFLHLQKNATKVFGTDLRNSPTKIADELNLLMESSKSIQELCKMTT